MLVQVPIKDIETNPFQARKKINRDTIKQLAEEIKSLGLWPGTIKGRMKNGKVQLCYGHRRIEALKFLGYKDVQIEIEDLNDEQMFYHSLAENLQREDLTDIEKAEAIQKLLDRLKKQGSNVDEALKKTSKILGLSEGWIKTLLGILSLEPQVQKAIREKKIAGRTALEAYRFGGKEFVKTAAKEKLAVHKIAKMAQKIRDIPNTSVQDRLKKEIVSGKITDLREVEKKARGLLKSVKTFNPEDLERLATIWSGKLSEWDAGIEELLIYGAKLKANIKLFSPIKSSASSLVKKLNRILS